RARMEKEDREEVDELLQYHPESAGGLMSPDFMHLDEVLVVRQRHRKPAAVGLSGFYPMTTLPPLITWSTGLVPNR
ncbi:MAG TPA: hypothetical protein EYP52_07170, partial [Anaerolineae bacterium]|nr:hypothetical protein [Anaerolineae bacterium]